MKKGLIAAVLLGLTMAGCSDPKRQETDVTHITYTLVDTPQGEVPCLVYAAGYKGGISCDWGHKP